MWTKYCGQNNGVCVEINENILFENLKKKEYSLAPDYDGIFKEKVSYVSNPIKIHFNDFYSSKDGYFNKMLFTKFENFQFENETRIIIPECKDQLITFPSGLVKKVILCNPNEDIYMFVKNLKERVTSNFDIDRVEFTF